MRASEQGVSFGWDARSVLLVTGTEPKVAKEHVAEYLFQRYVGSFANAFRRRRATAARARCDVRPLGADVHVVVDNSSTHKTPAIQRWLLRHPRFTFHYTPTYSSWLNLVERSFAELTSKWLRRGTHRSVKELVASIRAWITNWNDQPRPFVWHKTADEILDNLAAYCARESPTQDTRSE